MKTVTGPETWTGSQPVFRHWLKEQRKYTFGYTQEEFARLVGCSVVTIRRIEEGVLRPSRQLAELIAEALEVPAEHRPAIIQWTRSDPLKSQSQQSPTPAAGAIYASSDSLSGAQARNPYKGLRPFQETDTSDFFGREALTARLLSRLSEQAELARFLAVVGPSGSGKSSVVRAGLIPALRRQGLPGGIRPVLADIVPGAHPMQELAAALLRVASRPFPGLVEQLQIDEGGLARAVSHVLLDQPHAALLLVIDQFEEVFTLVQSEATRRLLLNNLWKAITDPSTPLWVVVTLRADFYDRPLLYTASCRLIRERTEVVGPLEPDELLRAIVRPAQRVGVELEPELTAIIEQEVGNQAGALPFMEYALTELFERREGALMRLSSYRESGGVQGALGRRAEEIFSSLSPSEQEETRQVFLRLVALGEGVEDTRRRALRSELASAARDEESFEQVLEMYGKHRLLTFDRDVVTKGPTVEVAHEALLRAWARLSEWLEQSRADIRVQRQLMSASVEWAASGKDASYLATGIRLAQFKPLAAGADRPGGVTLTADEQEYLAASLAEDERQRRFEDERRANELGLQKRAAARLRYIVVGLAAFLVIAAVLVLWALDQSRVAQANALEANTQRQFAQNNAATAVASEIEADRQRGEAEANLRHSEAQRLAAESNVQMESHADLAALLAVRSLETEFTPQGDAVLTAAMDREYPVRRFIGHTGWIQGVAYSPDGKYVVTTSGDKTARLWDVSTGEEVRRFTNDTGELRGVAFSPDGKHILAGSLDKTAKLWDIETSKVLQTFSGHTAQLNPVAFSPDGKWVLTGSRDSTARVWDAATGREIWQITCAGYVSNVLYSPDGRYIAVGCLDGLEGLWNASTGQQVRSFHTGVGVYSGAFSPDGRTIATAHQDDLVRLWDVETGKELRRFAVGTLGVFTVAFSPDGKYLATGGGDHVMRLWDPQSEALLRIFTGHTNSVVRLAFSPDGRYIVSGSPDKTAFLWDIASPPLPPRFVGHTAAIRAVRFSQDGKWILTASDDGTARLWDAHTASELRSFSGSAPRMKDASLSFDGKYVLTVGPEKSIKLWDAATGIELRTFSGLTTFPKGAALSPGGSYLVVASEGTIIGLWDAQTGRDLWQNATSIPPAQDRVGMAFSADSKYLLTPNGNNATIWDVQMGKVIREFNGHTGAVNQASFSPDGEYVVTVSDDKTARLWDSETGGLIRSLSGPASMRRAAFSSDSRYAIVTSLDGTARLWDTATGDEVHRYAYPDTGIEDAALSPDGRWALLGLRNGTARLVRVDYHEAVRDLCSRLTRDFTAEERAEYHIIDAEPTCPQR